LAKARLEKTRLDVLKDSYVAFLDVLLAQNKLRIAENTLAVLRDRSSSVSQSYDLGTTSRIQMLSEQSSVLNQQGTNAALALSLNEKKAVLADLLGMETASLPTLVGELRFIPFDVGRLSLEMALQSRTDMLRLRIARQLLELDRYEDHWRPILSARVAYARFDGNIGTSRNQAIAGLLLEVPFPRLDQRRAEKELAAHDLNELYQDLSETLMATKRERRRLIEKLNTLARQLELLHKAAVSTEEQVAASRESYAMGRMTSLSLQIVEHKLDEAKTKYFETLFDYLTTLANIRRMHALAPFNSTH